MSTNKKISGMKQWPANGATVLFSELVESVRECVDYHYRLSRKNTVDPMDYQGYDIGTSAKATSLSPAEALSLEQLDYDLTSQDRDAMDVIIGIAIQLGVEQGIRLESTNSLIYKTMFEALIERLPKEN